MKKVLLLPLLMLLVTGCGDPLDEFIYSSGVQICGQTYVLGDSLQDTETAESVTYNEAEKTFTMNCNEVGLYLLGSGTPTRQVIPIDEIAFSTNDANRIDSISGRWRILTSIGKNHLDSLQSSPDSVMYADSIHYYRQTLKMDTDIRQLVFDIHSDFDEPHSESPVGWSTENGSISFYSDENEREAVFRVSTNVEDF
ncbi:MAG: hypothetical protein GVY07_15155 [Bacteroidetes bacterium]|jgi:hypothetical protein|nr:hypothetical protein [Bacteroidota bacterium]